jgi:hypothetical protein
MAVSTERQRGRDAAVVGAQVSDHVPPERSVHDQAMGEDEDGPITSAVLVFDDARGELNL